MSRCFLGRKTRNLRACSRKCCLWWYRSTWSGPTVDATTTATEQCSAKAHSTLVRRSTAVLCFWRHPRPAGHSSCFSQSPTSSTERRRSTPKRFQFLARYHLCPCRRRIREQMCASCARARVPLSCMSTRTYLQLAAGKSRVQIKAV